MGIFRKTASIATLGLVNWRSKGELLERERAALAKTNTELETQTKKAEKLSKKVSEAENRLYKAELEALADAAAAKRKKRRARRKALLTDGAKSLASDATDVAVKQSRSAKRSLRKAEKKARKKAAKATDAVQDTVSDATDSVKDLV